MQEGVGGSRAATTPLQPLLQSHFPTSLASATPHSCIPSPSSVPCRYLLSLRLPLQPTHPCVLLTAVLQGCMHASPTEASTNPFVESRCRDLCMVTREVCAPYTDRLRKFKRPNRTESC